MAAYVGPIPKGSVAGLVYEAQMKKEAAVLSQTKDIGGNATTSAQTQSLISISVDNFKTALNVLDQLTSLKSTAAIPAIQFTAEYHSQNLIITAIKILHKVNLEGSDKQKEELSLYRDKIISLNALLKNDKIGALAKEKLGIQMTDEAINIKGMQVALPLTTSDYVGRGLTWLPRALCTGVADGISGVAGAFLLGAAAYGAEFNPKDADVKEGKIPILLIHGSGFNESEWWAGRKFLNKEEYGSVFSLNCDGLVTYDPKKGIEDYARDKISQEVKRIKALTGSDRVILMGHSMGGLIAGYYAEYFAEKDQVHIVDVISIASPWQGSPTIDTLGIGKNTKRYQQMSVKGGTALDTNFRQKLVAKALESERKGLRKYYNIWSRMDYAVPFNSGSLTEDPRRQYSYGILGHYSIIAWPGVWQQIRSWLDEIYAAAKPADTNAKSAYSSAAGTTASQPSSASNDAKDSKTKGPE